MRDEICRAIEVLKRGGLILYPTDTVWGIGCDATNSEAVSRIYSLKRSENKLGMLILVDSIDRAACYTTNVPSVAWELMEVSDKPLTLILPGGVGVASNLIPAEGSIGVRVPQHEFCSALLRSFRKPIVSTSANVSGEPTPLKFSDISQVIIDGVDFVVSKEYERGATGSASSIISISESSEIKVIR